MRKPDSRLPRSVIRTTLQPKTTMASRLHWIAYLRRITMNSTLSLLQEQQLLLHPSRTQEPDKRQALQQVRPLPQTKPDASPTQMFSERFAVINALILAALSYSKSSSSLPNRAIIALHLVNFTYLINTAKVECKLSIA